MKIRTMGIIIGVVTLAWLVRTAATGSPRFAFLVPNVVLAMVPLLMEPLFRRLATHKKSLLNYLGTALVAAIWMLFLPNAFYILTDFMHLNSSVLVNRINDGHSYHATYARGDGLYLYDSLLILAITLVGAYVGGLALVHAYKWLLTRTETKNARAALISIMLLSSVGVYIGRYGRWNSWEGLMQPQAIITDLLRSLFEAEARARLVWVIGTIMLFQVASFWYVLRQEHLK